MASVLFVIYTESSGLARFLCCITDEADAETRVVVCVFDEIRAMLDVASELVISILCCCSPVSAAGRGKMEVLYD